MQIPFIGRFYDNPVLAQALPVPQPRRARIGLALGAGAARGWSHIGVLHELVACGLVPDIVAGSSIGAVVGGCFVAGRLAELEAFARSLTPRRVFSLMDLTFSGAGLLGGGKLKSLLERQLSDTLIENLPTRFGAVATELGTGHEVWLTNGQLSESVRASYALPGIFEPVRIAGRWLFDGALVNPVPVTLCRALGADVVIAVNLVSDNYSTASVVSDELSTMRGANDEKEAVPRTVGGSFRQHFSRSPEGPPGMATAMMEAFNITQDRIARSRLAGDPPDVTVRARVGKIGLFDFHRAEELIFIGREAARRAIADMAQDTGLVAQTAPAGAAATG